MDAIYKLTCSIGGYRNYIVDLIDGLKAYTKLWEDEEPLSLWDDDNAELFTKDVFTNTLKDLWLRWLVLNSVKIRARRFNKWN
ncbi:hypothetical protein KHA80_07510 [Anaerobacillus sp. HL2]|nr:hypothetical protein KHA80_07510 [Anaerobacillus sp. HL2]